VRWPVPPLSSLPPTRLPTSLYLPSQSLPFAARSALGWFQLVWGGQRLAGLRLAPGRTFGRRQGAWLDMVCTCTWTCSEAGRRSRRAASRARALYGSRTPTAVIPTALHQLGFLGRAHWGAGGRHCSLARQRGLLQCVLPRTYGGRRTVRTPYAYRAALYSTYPYTHRKIF
jgi:hypothetical protein